jgi:hypothetical protein
MRRAIRSRSSRRQAAMPGARATPAPSASRSGSELDWIPAF